MCVPNLILDDVICSCCMADGQFPHHNMGPYGPPVRLIDRWMTPMRTSRPSPKEPGTEWQPVSSQRASLNLKVISLTPSFSFLHFSTLFLLLLGLSFLLLSLALSRLPSPSFQKSLSFFLSPSVGIFVLQWRPLSFFTVSPPPLSFSPWLCLSPLYAVFYPCVTKS